MILSFPPSTSINTPADGVFTDSLCERNILSPSICILCVTSEGIDSLLFVVPHVKKKTSKESKFPLCVCVCMHMRACFWNPAGVSLTLFPSAEAMASCVGPTVVMTLCRCCGLFPAWCCTLVITTSRCPLLLRVSDQRFRHQYRWDAELQNATQVFLRLPHLTPKSKFRRARVCVCAHVSQTRKHNVDKWNKKRQQKKNLLWL